MNKFTIQQLQQMRESEDRVEIKAELLIETESGIQLTPLYEEMKQRAGVTDRKEVSDVPVNGTLNGTVNAQILSEMLCISLRTVKRDLHTLRDMSLIQYVGSDKTGHWEIVNE